MKEKRTYDADVAYFWGGHKDEVPEERRKETKTCALCDRPVYFSGNISFAMDSDFKDIPEGRSARATIYLATSCFERLSAIYQMAIFKGAMRDYKLHHKHGEKNN